MTNLPHSPCDFGRMRKMALKSEKKAAKGIDRRRDAELGEEIFLVANNISFDVGMA